MRQAKLFTSDVPAGDRVVRSTGASLGESPLSASLHPAGAVGEVHSVNPLAERKSWSRNHESCIECRSTRLNHSAHGRCRTCVKRELRRRRCGAESRLAASESDVPTHRTRAPHSEAAVGSLQIITQAGELSCVPNHTVLCLEGEEIVCREASRIRRGDYLVGAKSMPHGESPRAPLPIVTRISKRKKPILQPTAFTADFAYLIGYICGDGGIHHRPNQPIHTTGRLQWTDENRVQSEEIARIVTAQFGIAAKVVDRRPATKSHYGYADSALLCEWLEINCPEAVAQSVYEKAIPTCIETGGADLAANFLAGLYDAEGYLKERQVILNMTSKRCVLQAALLLARFGILGTYDVIPSKPPRHTVYRLTISDGISVSAFRKWIPLRHPVRSRMLAAYRARRDCKGARNVPAMKNRIAALLRRHEVPKALLPGFNRPGTMISESTASKWMALLRKRFRNTSETQATLDGISFMYAQRWARVKSIAARR